MAVDHHKGSYGGSLRGTFLNGKKIPDCNLLDWFFQETNHREPPLVPHTENVFESPTDGLRGSVSGWEFAHHSSDVLTWGHSNSCRSLGWLKVKRLQEPPAIWMKLCLQRDSESYSRAAPKHFFKVCSVTPHRQPSSKAHAWQSLWDLVLMRYSFFCEHGMRCIHLGCMGIGMGEAARLLIRNQ